MARSVAALSFGLALFSGQVFAADALSDADNAAAFAAAGFTIMNGEYMRCDDTVSISRVPGHIELADLNGDGQPEAFVKESSIICYGNTGEAFVLLGKTAAGWTVLLDQVGIPVTLETGNQGWPDIEVGGPGFGAFPRYRFDGTHYMEMQ
jgi:hypothetical protein